MRLHIPIVLAIFICLSYTSLAQDRKGIKIVGGGFATGKNFFVGEIHALNELADFKVDLIQYLYQKHGVTDIVIEYGRSRAYLCNNYLETGDTTLFSYSSQKFNEWMKRLKKAHDAQPTSGKFRIYGIDFERIEHIKVTKMLLDKHPEAFGTKLSAYVNNIAPSVYIGEYGSFKTTESGKYKKMRSLFSEEKEILKQLLQNDYPVLEGILSNPASYYHFKRRNRDMYTNLLQLEDTKRNFICIIGGSHTELHDSKAFLSHYIEDKNKQNNTVLIDMACDCGSIRGLVTGPKVLRSNEAAFSKAFSKYYKPGEFILVEQNVLDNLRNSIMPLPTYYVFFKDQIFN